MKLKFLAIICFGMFFNSNVFGQENDTKIKNEIEQDSLSIAVSADAMNVLYIGLDNPVSIAVSGYEADKIVAKISEGTIFKNGNNYIVNIRKRGEVLIEIYALGNDSILTLLGIKKFRAREFSKISTKPAKVIERDYNFISEIRANTSKINIGFEDGLEISGIKYDVSEFNLNLVVKDGESPNSIFVQGNKLTVPCLDMLKQMESGDLIIIDMIKADSPNRTISLAPIFITVK